MTVAGVHSAARRRWFAWTLWLTLTVVVVAAIRGLPWADILRHLGRVRPPWVVAAVVANLAILPLWAAEWRLLVPNAFRVTYRRMFEIVAISASVLNAVPFFAGEASAVALLIGRAGLARSAALSVLALDQLLVAFAKLGTLGAAALLVELPDWLRVGLLTLSTGFIVLLLALMLLAHFWERAHVRISGVGALRTLAARVVTWGRHLDTLRQTRRAVLAMTLALLKKGAEVVAVMATQLAFGLDPSLSIAILVVAALAITTLLPVAPANLGVYEATVFAIYRYVGVPADVAVGLALVQHACFLLPSVATGYTLATLGQLRQRLGVPSVT